MILTIDAGNTSITCGIFDQDRLVSKFRIPSDINRDFVEVFRRKIFPTKISGAIISSVVEELDDRLCCAVEKVCGIKPVMLSYNSNMPVTLKLENNSEIGADRIANGVRAWNLYKKAVIVVDFGTAITFDIVNSKGEFIGGLIAPGLKTQFDSLGKATSKLPDIGIDYIEKVIGNNTRDAILAGVVRGTAAMIDGMLKQSVDELGENPVIIATGGFCEIVAKYMDEKFDLISHDFTIEGLFDLYKINKDL